MTETRLRPNSLEECHPAPHCPCCQGAECNPLGALHPVGGLLQLKTHGTLFECPECHLLFRDPYLAEEEVIEQYAALPAGLWETSQRPDFDLARKFLLRHLPEGRVLDVGCFRGDLLDGLPERYEKFGIEPSEAAAVVARKKGINIISKSLKETLMTNQQFDAILAIDLIEHLRDPLELISFARQTLRPEGFLIVATGNPDFWLWRRHRLNYWYLFTEHVAFLRESWFQWAARTQSLAFHSRTAFSHYAIPIKIKLAMARRSIEYELLTSSGRLGDALSLVPPFSRVRAWSSQPGGFWANDHHLVVLQQQGEKVYSSFHLSATTVRKRRLEPRRAKGEKHNFGPWVIAAISGTLIAIALKKKREK